MLSNVVSGDSLSALHLQAKTLMPIYIQCIITLLIKWTIFIQAMYIYEGTYT